MPLEMDCSASLFPSVCLCGEKLPDVRFAVGFKMAPLEQACFYWKGSAAMACGAEGCWLL